MLPVIFAPAAEALITALVTVLGAPLVERGLAEPALAADIPDWQA